MSRPAGTVHERIMCVRGHRLRVSVRGEGRPVLLMNGLGASISLWNALHEDLTDLQVISFDAPGTGRSSSPSRPYRMAELADMTAELLDALGHDRVTLSAIRSAAYWPSSSRATIPHESAAWSWERRLRASAAWPAR